MKQLKTDYKESLRTFTARTFTARRAGFALIVMDSPVNGLRPGRAAVAGLCCTVTFTRLGMVTGRPSLSSDTIISEREVNTLLT